jgi:hypothetical protein
MISHIRANELLDCYSSMLTNRQQEILQLYFAEDLSLSEIEEMLGISRAAVHDTISKGVKALLKWEDAAGTLALQKAVYSLIENHPELDEEFQTAFENAKEQIDADR